MTPKSTIASVNIKGVTKLFGSKRALCNVSLKVFPQEVVALIGQNGAGKSTLLSILSTMTKPTFGSVEIDGKPATSQIRAKIGYLSHKPFVYPELTCQENLSLFASLYGADSRAVGKMKEQMALEDFFLDRPAGVLSRGQLQRLALARALIATPEILLLDEPSAGLDNQSIGLIEQIVAEHQHNGGITFVVSHQSHMVANLSTKVVLLQSGEIEAHSEDCSLENVSCLLMGEHQ